MEWFLFQLHSPKHARVIIITLLMIRKAIILAFRSQGVNQKITNQNLISIATSTQKYLSPPTIVAILFS